MILYLFLFLYTIIAFFILLMISLMIPRLRKEKKVSSFKIFSVFYICNSIILYIVFSAPYWLLILINLFLLIGAQLLGNKLSVIGITGHRGAGRSEMGSHLERNYNCKVFNLDEMNFNILMESSATLLKNKISAIMTLNNLDLIKIKRVIYLEMKEKKLLDETSHKVVFRNLFSEILREKILFNTTYVFIDSYFLHKIPVLKLICYPIICICSNNRERLLQRIIEKDKFDLDTADNILCRQLPTETFEKFCEYCIINDSHLQTAQKKLDSIMDQIKNF